MGAIQIEDGRFLAGCIAGIPRRNGRAGFSQFRPSVLVCQRKADRLKPWCIPVGFDLVSKCALVAHRDYYTSFMEIILGWLSTVSSESGSEPISEDWSLRSENSFRHRFPCYRCEIMNPPECPSLRLDFVSQQEPALIQSVFQLSPNTAPITARRAR